MKTKIKLLFICLFLSLSFSINAQDASNDATWEETVEFLKENIKYAKEINYLYMYMSEITIEIVDDNILVKGLSGLNSNRTKDIAKIPLNKVKSAESYAGVLHYDGKKKEYIKDFEIKLFDEYGTCQYYSVGELKKSKISSLTIEFSDDLSTRMKRAFQHLAFLNSKKRKKSKF